MAPPAMLSGWCASTGAQEAEELSREELQQAHRSLSYFFDDDGSLVLKARLPAEGGMLVLKVLEAAIPERPLPPEDCEHDLHASAETSSAKAQTLQRSRGPRIPRSAQRADALAPVAESFIKHGAEALSGGERFQIVVHVDQDTLKERTAGRSEFEDGPGMAAEAARRHACECSYVKITEGEKGEPLDVGRKTPSIPPALKRALNSRDKRCVFPACTQRKYVDAHHVHHWSDGGETKPGNLVSLCRFHHRQVHKGGIRIERLDDGAWRFVRPNGEAYVSTSPGHTMPMPGDWETVVKQHAERDIPIDPHTTRTQWRRESMDYGLAIDALLGNERRAAERSSAGADWKQAGR